MSLTFVGAAQLDETPAHRHFPDREHGLQEVRNQRGAHC